MGRVRPRHIKRMAEEFVDNNEDRFSQDFEENKQALEELADFDSKKLRNRVAGYIVRVLRNKKF